MLLCPHKSLFCKFDFFIMADYVPGATHPCIYYPFVWPLWDLTIIIFFGLSPSIRLYQWKFFRLTSTPLFWTSLFTESPILQHLNAPFVQTTFLNYFKSYYSMTWHLCAILLLISYTGNLESLQFTFGKSNLSMTLYTNISSNSFYLRIEVWRISYVDTEFISPVLSNTVNKTKLINYYKHREHKIWNFTMVN